MDLFGANVLGAIAARVMRGRWTVTHQPEQPRAFGEDSALLREAVLGFFFNVAIHLCFMMHYLKGMPFAIFCLWWGVSNSLPPCSPLRGFVLFCFVLFCFVLFCFVLCLCL
jgi:hypothetical protein